MSLPWGETPEEELRRAAAQLMLNRVALVLVAEARRRGDFGGDEEELRARAVELAGALAVDDAAIDPRAPIELKLRRDGRIDLKLAFGEGRRVDAGLRGDGFVLSGGVQGQGRERTWQPSDMTDADREEKRRRDLAFEASRGKRKFRGKRYLRTVAAPAQPGIAERILAVELYGDGLIVELTHDVERVPDEQLQAEAENPYLPRHPGISVADDLGTEYYEGGRASYGGGPGGVHAHLGFCPAVPGKASILRITTDSGTVAIDLTA